MRAFKAVLHALGALLIAGLSSCNDSEAFILEGPAPFAIDQSSRHELSSLHAFALLAHLPDPKIL